MLAPLAIAAVLIAGHSAQGRPIVAHQRGDPAGAERVLVVGCIHGTECAGMRVVRVLRRMPLPPGIDLWLVPDLDPDGLAHGTRLNGRGVDLNRNFPAGWRPGGRPGDLQYPGPRPFSEPETRAARRLIDQVRPDVTIWYHQHMDLVWAWGASRAAGAAYARAAGMRFAPMPMAGRHGAALAEHRPQTSARSWSSSPPGRCPAPRRGARHVASWRPRRGAAARPGRSPGRSRSLRAVPLLLVAVAYAIGCISPGYLLVRRATGLDLRAAQTGSTGARNAGRMAGRRVGAAVFALDAGKGASPSGWPRWRAPATWSRPPVCWPWSPATCSRCSFACAAAAASRRRWAGCWSPYRSPRWPPSSPARSVALATRQLVAAGIAGAVDRRRRHLAARAGLGGGAGQRQPAVLICAAHLRRPADQLQG